MTKLAPKPNVEETKSPSWKFRTRPWLCWLTKGNADIIARFKDNRMQYWRGQICTFFRSFTSMDMDAKSCLLTFLLIQALLLSQNEAVSESSSSFETKSSRNFQYKLKSVSKRVTKLPPPPSPRWRVPPQQYENSPPPPDYIWVSHCSAIMASSGSNKACMHVPLPGEVSYASREIKYSC